jgi:hypothetical protein
VRTAILMEKRIAPFPNVRFIHSCHTGRKADENTLLCFWNPWFLGVGGKNILLPMINSGLTIISHEKIEPFNPPRRPVGNRNGGAPALPLLPGASDGGGWQRINEINKLKIGDSKHIPLIFHDFLFPFLQDTPLNFWHSP